MELRDRNNRYLGRVEQIGFDGRLVLHDRHNRYLGQFSHGETRDRSNRLVGRGNLLTLLLSTDLPER